MVTAREKLANCISKFIHNEWKPLIQKTGVSFICSVDGDLHISAGNKEELKKEIKNLLKGLLDSGYVDKVEIAELLSRAEAAWWENN